MAELSAFIERTEALRVPKKCWPSRSPRPRWSSRPPTRRRRGAPSGRMQRPSVRTGPPSTVEYYAVASLIAQQTPLLVLGFVMTPDRGMRRQLMRDTTLCDVQRQRVRAVHIISSDHERALSAEQAAHGDLLFLTGTSERGAEFKQADCAKKTHMFFSWALQNYPSTPYYAKAEDDSFVHLPRLLL
eukprot:5085513-Prymnesium_polylepis.1